MYKTNIKNMEELSLDKSKQDPSQLKQKFTDVKIDLHCCRYWKLEEWECQNMAYPFWRLYHNTIKGATVYFNDQSVELNPEFIILIPPGTAFSTHLKTKGDNLFKESIIGSRIKEIDEIEKFAKLRKVDHLFVHFNLGFQFDKLEPNIYKIPVDEKFSQMIASIKRSIIKDPTNFNFFETAAILNLILGALGKIPLRNWFCQTLDHRVIKILRYIDNHISEKLENERLASQANMAVNSFLRLFRKNTGTSIQQYIQKKRIEKSLVLLHHTIDSIDEIAEKCGFCDRFHFSRIFKKHMDFTPSSYRKRLTLQ